MAERWTLSGMHFREALHATGLSSLPSRQDTCEGDHEHLTATTRHMGGISSGFYRQAQTWSRSGPCVLVAVSVSVSVYDNSGTDSSTTSSIII